MSEDTTGLAERSRSWVAPAVVLGVAPAVGYFVAYLHELGFWSVFDAPTPNITIDLGSIAGAVLAVLAVAVGIFLVLNITYTLSQYASGHPVSRILFAVLGPGFIFVYAAWTIFPKQPAEWLWPIPFLAFLLALELLLPLLYQRTRAGYAEKLAAQAELESRSRSLISRFVHQTSTRTQVFLIAFLALLYFSYATGRASALNDSTYWVRTGPHTQYVLLRHYGEDWFFAPVDKKGHFHGVMQVVRADSSHAIDLTRKKIGPLVQDCTWFAGCHPTN